MESSVLYGSILKTQLFRLGGFIVKKNNSKFSIHSSALILYKKNNYTFLDPQSSTSQLVFILKFYSDLLLYKNNVVIASFIKNKLFLNNFNKIKSKIFVFTGLMGGLFSNKFAISWSMLSQNLQVSQNLPSLVVALDHTNHFTILKELFCLGVPTIGFISTGACSKYITYPLNLRCNIYILYFFIRLFLRLLLIYRHKD